MIIDKLFSFLVPYECINCESEGFLLCGDCRPLLQQIPKRCYRCLKISEQSKTCRACRKQTKLNAVFVPVVYEGLAKELVWRLKYKSAKGSAREIAAMMRKTLPSCSGLVFVPAPTTTRRARQRGYDQAKLIAKELSRQTKGVYVDCLARHGSIHQVGSSRLARKKQIEGVFRFKKNHNIQNQHIILVDDVLTTGSTLEAAAFVLKKAEAKRVSAAVFAQTE